MHAFLCARTAAHAPPEPPQIHVPPDIPPEIDDTASILEIKNSMADDDYNELFRPLASYSSEPPPVEEASSESDEERTYNDIAIHIANDVSDDDGDNPPDSKLPIVRNSEPKTVIIDMPHYCTPLYQCKWFYMLQRHATDPQLCTIIRPHQCNAAVDGVPCRIKRNGFETRFVHHLPLPYSITYPVYICTRHSTSRSRRGVYVHYFMHSSQTWGGMTHTLLTHYSYDTIMVLK